MKIYLNQLFRLTLFRFSIKQVIKILSITSIFAITCLFIVKNYPSTIQNISGEIFQTGEIDLLEFAPNHPEVNVSALEQLKGFTAPQFKLNHQLMPNFIWMDPTYMAGLLQPNYKIKNCVPLSTKIQAELAFYWHYYFLVNNNLKLYKNYRDTNTFAGSWVNYANLHPELSTAAISFWAQIQPYKIGGNCSAKTAYIGNKDLPDSCYVHNENNEIISKKHISPLIPIELLQCDFQTQSMYVDSLLNVLIRPLQMINENGETFRLYSDEILENDNRISIEKEKYANLSWNEFQAIKRIEREIAYKNSFMLKPNLDHCLYTEYSIDGQNKYRHNYKTMRVVNSIINNQYYSTPDFYPRYPSNWKDWKGPWHGLKWLEICRKTEIDLGDNLFSPFVAAGWDSIETNNIRPAQWLGLLKILGAMGAEFYYSGFFNTGKQVAKPENYVWQAVMPVYAQGVTSFYEDILRNGNIYFSENLIQYPESDVPVVIRKSKNKKIWVIACTWQTGTNFNNNIGQEKIIKVNVGNKKITLKARRQGSVYVYSEEKTQPLFYQIDTWHEYKHPYHWSKNIKLEAELYLDNAKSECITENDYTKFVAYANLNLETVIPFDFHGINNQVKTIHFWLRNNEIENKMDVYLDEIKIGEIKALKKKEFMMYSLNLNPKELKLNNTKHHIKIMTNGKSIMLDKVELEIN